MVGGLLYFAADDGVHGKEVWSSDGTFMGTRMVADIDPAGDGAAYRIDIAQVGSELLFAAKDGTSGTELWRSDGTAEGTSPVADIWPGADSSYPGKFIVLNEMLLFIARDGTGGGLWRSQGTMGPTEMVGDIDGLFRYSFPGILFDDQIYFGALVRDGVPGLWRTDGTAEGTQLILELPPYHLQMSNLEVAGDKLFFVANDPEGRSQLWVSDGTTDGTKVIRPPGVDRYFHAAPQTPMLGVGGEVYFTASFQLWKSDGTDAGTVPVDAASGAVLPGSPMELVQNQDGTLVFAADHPIYYREVWKLPVAVAEVQLTTAGSTRRTTRGRESVCGTRSGCRDLSRTARRDRLPRFRWERAGR